MLKGTVKKKTPIVLQMDALECGAASLCIILAYYGKKLPLEKLREDCNVSRDGSNVESLVKAGILHGLETKLEHHSAEELFSLNFPLILQWKSSHYLVMEGHKGNTIYLNDPAEGHRTVSYSELKASISGQLLTFKPSASFVGSNLKVGLLSGLRDWSKGYEKVLAFLVIVGLLLVIPGLIIPIFTKIFIDDILIGGLDDWFIPLIIGMVLTLILKAALEILRNKYLLRARSKLDIVSSAKYLWHVVHLPMNFFNQRFSGEIGSRVNLNTKITTVITDKLVNNFLNIIVIIFYFMLMLKYDVFLTIVGTTLALVNVFTLKFISAKRGELYYHFSLEEGKLLSLSMTGLQNIESLKAMGRENDFFVKWAGFFTKALNEKQRLAVLTNLLNTLPNFLSQFLKIVILSLGALRVMDGYITMGMLVAFNSLMSSFSAPIESLIGLITDIQEVKGDMNRLQDVMNNKIDPLIESEVRYEPDAQRPEMSKLEGYVEFKNVTFGYNKIGAPLLNNFSLKIKPGERVAIVGKSGSGKSTVAKLLAGFYEPTEGQILLDGLTRQQLPRQVINDSLNMVSQDIFLFEGTVRDVLTLWDRSISDKMLIEAAKDACIHDIISAKHHGYDYYIQEGGKNFSGGERQLFEIARALITNPSIIIMDEGTSILDPSTEKKVMDNIRKRKCSVLVVAHRLSTVRDCNEIIVMSNGNVVERGTHNELVKNKGEYSQLIKM